MTQIWSRNINFLIRLFNTWGSRHSLFIYLLTVTTIFSTTGCSEESETVTETQQILRVGVLPDENEQVLQNKYRPLMEYLATQSGIRYELKTSKNYEGLLDLFTKNEIDLAYFGGVTFVNAQHNAGAIPLVMRDIDTRFTSYFICQGNNTAKNIDHFKGKVISFGSKLSTSGHFMPRHFLEKKGINPESYFSAIKYSGAHDKTAFFIRDGIADIGVANSSIIDTMLKDGRLVSGDIKIIWETPPYADYVWAIQKNFPEKIKFKIREAFLALSPTDEEHRLILDSLDAGGFIPAKNTDFEHLHKILYPTGNNK